MKKIALFLFCCVICAGAAAQTIYRSVMPDGKIVFGDKPAPGAKESGPVVLRQPNVSTPGPTSTSGASPRQQTMDRAAGDVSTAQQTLERARAALEAGREPTPEERIGTKTGSRTTEAYDQRIKALEQNVVAAQKQLDDANNRRNDVR